MKSRDNAVIMLLCILCILRVFGTRSKSGGGQKEESAQPLRFVAFRGEGMRDSLEAFRGEGMRLHEQSPTRSK